MLLIDCVICGEVLSSHQCSLLYQSGDRRRLDFGVSECDSCRENNIDPEELLAKKLQYIDSCAFSR